MSSSDPRWPYYEAQAQVESLEAFRGGPHVRSAAQQMEAANAAPLGAKQRLLFMGLKRSGKSSIVNVILYHLPPQETLFIPTTMVIKKHFMYSFRNFQIWDLPGQMDYFTENFDTDNIFSNAGAMVWVLDAQDDYLDSVARLTDTILVLEQRYPDIKYAVFIHKVDSLSTDYREDTVRDITQRIMDNLNDAGLENPPISFYSTSVYDESIYEAMSKVVQMLNTQLDTFENMLNTLSTSCKFQKLYLFDIMTKLYVASDTSPVDLPSYTVCSDFIDTIVDLCDIYNWEREQHRRAVSQGDGQVEEGASGPPAEREVHADAEAMVVEIGQDRCLYLKEINKFLALIGISKEPRFAQEKPMVEHNVVVFSESLEHVFRVTNDLSNEYGNEGGAAGSAQQSITQGNPQG